MSTAAFPGYATVVGNVDAETGKTLVDGGVVASLDVSALSPVALERFDASIAAFVAEGCRRMTDELRDQISAALSPVATAT
jgi:hypothetical protein